MSEIVRCRHVVLGRELGIGSVRIDAEKVSRLNSSGRERRLLADSRAQKPGQQGRDDRREAITEIGAAL